MRSPEWLRVRDKQLILAWYAAGDGVSHVRDYVLTKPLAGQTHVSCPLDMRGKIGQWGRGHPFGYFLLVFF